MVRAQFKTNKTDLLYDYVNLVKVKKKRYFTSYSFEETTINRLKSVLFNRASNKWKVISVANVKVVNDPCVAFLLPN